MRERRKPGETETKQGFDDTETWADGQLLLTVERARQQRVSGGRSSRNTRCFCTRTEIEVESVAQFEALERLIGGPPTVWAGKLRRCANTQ